MLGAVLYLCTAMGDATAPLPIAKKADRIVQQSFHSKSPPKTVVHRKRTAPPLRILRADLPPIH